LPSARLDTGRCRRRTSAAPPGTGASAEKALTRAIPFRRIAQPIDAAQAVAFFLSARSDYITG
jgi:2-hydroxycyclohexanecarboxyl-CoA dehydrogenase